MRRDLIIGILATFCLTATLFTAIPTRSTSPYDPWFDVNDDGIINIQDIAALAIRYQTTGDPTKNVNVTNPRAKVVEKDLNISIVDTSGGGQGYSSVFTDVFDTEGYDRMFVSMAIIDVKRNMNYAWITVNLNGTYWCWGIVNGTYLKTCSPAPTDCNGGILQVSVWNYSDLPVSSSYSSEFPVKANQCSLWLIAMSSLMNISRAWVLVRVSIYLTAGTTSPPFVQDVNVMNWPSPSYNNYWTFIHAPIIDGHGWNSTSVGIGGFSRMFVNIEIVNASYQGVPIWTTISLNSIDWNYYGGYESVSSNVLNATYGGGYLPVYSQQTPPEFKSKNSACILYFYINSGAFTGWIDFYVNIYLRNE